MLDTIDHQLLVLLQDNCLLSYGDLGERVGLSVSAVNERLKKLRAQGIIRRSVAIVDPHALGLHICAFVEVSIERAKRVAAFAKEMQARPEVLECHRLASDATFLLKVRVASTEELERFLSEQVLSTRGIARTRVTVVLATKKEETRIGLPVPAIEDE